MQNLQALRRRIRSVQSTQKITRAMQMVAGAKLRRAQSELLNFRPYAAQLQEIVKRFLNAHPGLSHPFLGDRAPAGQSVEEVPEVSPAGLILISSDTGLCGSYNERVIDAADRFLRENRSAVVVAIGRKGNRALARRGVPRVREIIDWGGRYKEAPVAELSGWIQQMYLTGAVSGWWAAYTQFVSALRFKPVVELVLPLQREASEGLSDKVIVEPALSLVAEALLRRFVNGQFRRVLLEAFTSENSARMLAMKNATDNAAEVVSHLTLVRNKARQAAITKELIEVVSGAEALR